MVHRPPRLLLGLLLCVAASSAAAQQPASVDPVLRALLRSGVRARLDRMPRTEARDTARPRSVFGTLTLSATTAAGAGRISIFLDSRDPAAADAVRAVGGDVLAEAGGIIAANVPVAALEELSRSGRFDRIEAARRVRIADDSSIIAISAQEVREQVGGSWLGFDGGGTLVGIYDTGIDFRHEDFIGPDGKTRVLGIWDQTDSSASPPTGFTFGRYCSPDDIQQGIDGAAAPCREHDIAGHGTHVAGIAAGDGSAGTTDYRYAGVAPAAGLLIVKGGNASFSEENIAAGLQWLKEESQRLGRPIAVNLSLGSSFGPHDGTRLYEQMLDSLSGRGYIVSVAAGNNGNNRDIPASGAYPLIHGEVVPAAGTTRELDIAVPNYVPTGEFCSDYAVNDAWYGGPDQLVIRVTRPDGTSLQAVTGDTVVQSVTSTGLIYIDNASTGPDPENGDNEAYIEFSNCDPAAGAPQAGIWKIEVTPAPATTPTGEPFDLWLFDSALGSSEFAGGAAGFDNRSTVESPGSAKRAITAGAFLSSACFPSTDGNTYCSVPEFQEPSGDIAVFSGAGPTRDDRQKPDISAPGRIVISTLSSDASFSEIFISPDDRHVALQGTSMAAPHMTGATALFLQADSTLTPEDLRAVLAGSADTPPIVQHSYVDGDPGGIPNLDWGWGKLDVKAALVELGATSGASTLAVEVTKLTPPASPSSAQGTRIALLDVHLTATGSEPVNLYQVGFRVSGSDAGANVVLIADQNGDQAIEAGEPQIGSAPVGHTGPTDVSVPLEAPLAVTPGTPIDVIAAVQMSGNAPNGSVLRLTYLPAQLRSAGAETHVTWLRSQPTLAVASDQTRTTVLQGEQVFALSQNPIRSSPVYFNFSVMPDRAAIYTLTGRRVIDLVSRIDNGFRAVWDVTNDGDVTVAPGIYLLVVDVAGQRITQKLIITGEQAGGSD